MVGIAELPAGDSGVATASTHPLLHIRNLLDGELSASLAYRTLGLSLSEADSVCCRGLLRQFQEEHELAGEALGQLEVNPMPQDAALAGEWAKAAGCHGGLFGRSAGEFCALQHLKNAELEMLEEYVSRLPKLPAPIANFVRDQLVPAQRRHVHLIRELLGEPANA